MDYLTNLTPGTGSLFWIFFGIQALLLLGGLYLAFLHRDTLAPRATALQRLGYGMTVLGAIGLLLGTLRAGGVVPFSARYWAYLVALFELSLGVIALVYSRTTYREQLAAAERNRTQRTQPRRVTSTPARSVANSTSSRQATSSTSGQPPINPVPLEPRAPSRRREGRRDHKRRNKR